MSKQTKGGSGFRIEMFKVGNRLRNKLGMRHREGQPGHIDPRALAEADQLIHNLCETCPQEIEKNLAKLIKHWEKMRDMPDSPDRDKVAQDIFTRAHEIKDVASMCGYTLAAYFAESLRDYIGQTELNLQAQRVIIQAHVDALQVVHREGLKDEAGPLAEELKKMVKIAVDKYR